VSAVAHPLPEAPTPPRKRPRLQVVTPSPGVDLARAERAVADLLASLGQDPTSEQLADTPRRVAAGYAELLTPVAFNPTTFPNDEGYDQLVLVRAIPFQSLCQHHLLPFTGVAHVGYLPAGRILGLSKLARVVELYARRLQLQERLTTQVADWLQTQLEPKGVGVVLEAEHQCMTLRGGLPAPAPSPRPCTACSAATHAPVRSSSPSPPAGPQRPAGRSGPAGRPRHPPWTR
jgi:GTP cyclohydrolase IA